MPFIMYCNLMCLSLIHIMLTDTTAGSNEPKTLEMLGFLPMTGKGWIGGGACLPATLMALRHVNERQGLLDGYNLSYSWVDTQCDAGLATYKMTNMMHLPPTKIMLLGCGCSTESEATAQVSHLYNVTQLSYGSSSPILSNRNRFPNFFRLIVPDQKINPAKVALMNEYNWRKVATINQALEFFSMVIDDFVKRTKGTNITVVSQEIFEHDPLTRVENLKKHDARIIIVSCYEDKARLILCYAHKIGLFGQKIIWIFHGWYSSEFWRTNLEDIPCTEEDMEQAADGAFVIGYYPKNRIIERGVAGLTVPEFELLYKKEETYDSSNYNFESVSGQCYDHIWIAALALNCTNAYLKATDKTDGNDTLFLSVPNTGVFKDTGYHQLCIAGLLCFAMASPRIIEAKHFIISRVACHSKMLDEFSYADSDINEIIMSCISNISMIGITGSIYFENGADPVKDVRIERIQGGNRHTVGSYLMNSDPRYFEWIGQGIKWKGSIIGSNGVIPRDSTYVTYVELTLPAPLFISMTTFSALGIIAVLTFFVFNIVHRDNRFVKLSSPNINNILLLGCLLTYSTVFLGTTDRVSPNLCKARTFCFSVGFTTAFGALFSKTWRVYKIFTNKKLRKLTIKDSQLIGIVCILISVMITIIIVWEMVGPQHVVIKELPKEVYFSGNDAEVHLYVRICYSKYSSYFTWFIYMSEGGLLTFGAFLAWESRHVKIEALNDSRQIGLCIYNTVVLSAVGLTLTLLLEDQVVRLYGITSGCILIGTTATQFLVFIPKELEVRSLNHPYSLKTKSSQCHYVVMTSRSETKLSVAIPAPVSGQSAVNVATATSKCSKTFPLPYDQDGDVKTKQDNVSNKL